MVIKSRIKKIEEKVKEKKGDTNDVKAFKKFIKLLVENKPVPERVRREAFRRKTFMEWIKEIHKSLKHKERAYE